MSRKHQHCGCRIGILFRVTAIETARDRLATRSNSDWAAPILLLVGAFAAYAATAGYAVTSADAWAAQFGSWLLGTTGSPVVGGHPMPPLDDSPLRDLWVRQLSTGDEVIARPAGVVAAGVPAYWLAGSTVFTLGPGAVTAALISAVALVLTYLALRDRVSRREALLAAVALGFTTPVWSVGANGMWPHTLTVMGIAGFAWSASKERWLLAGVFASICLAARPHTIVIFGCVAALLWLSRRSLRVPLSVGVVCLAGLAASCVWNWFTFDSLSPLAAFGTYTTEGADRGNGFLTNQLGMWVAPDRGILIWTPILLVLLGAVVRSWRDLPDWTRALVVGGIVYTVIHAALLEFTGGDSFYGYRYTLELLACITPAFAMSARSMGRVAQAAFAPVLAIQACAITVGSIQDILLVPSDRAWHANTFLILLSNPVVLAILGIALAAAWLGRRIWLNP